MIIDPITGHATTELNRSTLNDYWGEYFAYEKNSELFELTKNALIKEINAQKEKGKEKVCVDSGEIISSLLNKLGTQHNFHRQFDEVFSELHKNQVLGMQLYSIMVNDKIDSWVYYETKSADAKYSHAVYFLSKKSN